MPAASTTLLARAEPLHPASEYETAGHFALRYEVRRLVQPAREMGGGAREHAARSRAHAARLACRALRAHRRS